jgi:hypothetical protein
MNKNTVSVAIFSITKINFYIQNFFMSWGEHSPGENQTETKGMDKYKR